LNAALIGGVYALSAPISIAETDRFRLKYQAFYSNEILTRLQPMTGSTGFTRLLCGRILPPMALILP
jgi:hypothetical protein